MDVHLWYSGFHCAHYPAISAAIIRRVYSALQADFGCPSLPSLNGTSRNFRVINVISRTTLAPRAALREGTEAAAIKANVGVIDIPIDDVGDCLTHLVFAQLIRKGTDVVKIAPFRAEQASDLSRTQFLAPFCTTQR